jgi:calcium-dependent protein kinase
MTEGVGTIYTMAPQVLQGIYTSKADLWSVGVISFMLLSSQKPFYHKRRYVVLDGYKVIVVLLNCRDAHVDIDFL